MPDITLRKHARGACIHGCVKTCNVGVSLPVKQNAFGGLCGRRRRQGRLWGRARHLSWPQAP
eukprot:scaffold363023_cov33-Prasinocladus_malaysianus.AAC.1